MESYNSLSAAKQNPDRHPTSGDAPRTRTLHGRLADITSLVSSLNDAVLDLKRSSLPPLTDDFDFYVEVQRFESSLIKGALRLTGGSQVKAAKLLKLKATTLNAKMRMLNLSSREIDLL